MQRLVANVVRFQLIIVLISFFVIFAMAYQILHDANISFIIAIITNVFIYGLIIYGDSKYGTHT